MTKTQLHMLSDDELLESLSHLLSRSRRIEADVVAHIAEADERKLYAGQACSSIFAPHLSEENAGGLLARACHKSKRQIEELVAEISPRPDAPALGPGPRKARLIEDSR